MLPEVAAVAHQRERAAEAIVLVDARRRVAIVVEHDAVAHVLAHKVRRLRLPLEDAECVDKAEAPRLQLNT
eukprot:4771063-Prymnesium_polylepis.1